MARVSSYTGKFVEQADTDNVSQPMSPQGCLAPYRDWEQGETGSIAGSILTAIAGCYFAPRCPHAENRCRQEEPPMYRVGDDHYAKCWLCEERGVPVS